MAGFLERECPACGGKGEAGRVASRVPAEALPFARLGEYWADFYKEKVFFTYVECALCGLMYCPHYFTGDQIGQLYADMAPNMDVIDTRALRATQQGYWRSVADLVAPGGDYLEIGPDVGYIVEQARGSGRFGHFWLFEPNAAVHGVLARAAGDVPATISTAMDDLSAVPDGSISLAVMIHVLDHLLEPRASLADIRAKLRPDGVLLVVTHNEKSLLRRVMGRRWPPFCLQHPEIYNPRSITGLLGRAGYGKVAVSRSTNHFPLDFLIRQAAFVFGVKLDKVPLPRLTMGLKLGNIQTVAWR